MGCSVGKVPLDDGLGHSRRIVHVAVPGFSQLYTPLVHHDCIHNQNIAIHNRVAGVVPLPTKPGLDAMRLGARLIKRFLPKTEQEELGIFAEKYPPRKRDRYMRALAQVLDEGLTREDSSVTMFIKGEKMNPDKVNPDPRAIQFRNPKYCVVLASFLKPIEEHLYALKIKHPLLATHTRLVGKGLNQVERAALLKRKMAVFSNPVVLSLDMSRFDQHVDVEALKIEHSVYTYCNNDPWFQRLLSWQLCNTVRTRTGFKYTTKGKRMSGDMNTALGNCIIMIAMVLGWLIPMGIRFDLLDDGDDCLLVIEEDNLCDVYSTCYWHFLSCGHEAKIENVSRDIHGVVWCQSSVIDTFDGLKFVRNPIKVMSSCLVGARWLVNSLDVRKAYLKGLGTCEMVLNRGVPVLQAYAQALVRNAGDVEAQMDTTSGEWFRVLRETRSVREAAAMPITDAARLSFAQAFGIGIMEQLEMESFLQSWTFSLSGDVTAFGEFDVERWQDRRLGRVECY